MHHNVTIEPFTTIKGPCYIGQHSLIKSHTEINTAYIGQHCKVAGEINRSIIQSYSNKAHYGYLGDSIVGEWVNLGAGSTTSNLKLTYGNVSSYDLPSNAYVNTNLQFLGTIFGDFVKTGIQSSFDCGTIIGSFCSLYGQTPHQKFVPPFTWGEPADYRSQNLESAQNPKNTNNR